MSKRWIAVSKFDRRARELADRHYSRRKIGNPQFAPPGRVLVLLHESERALWISRIEAPERTKHAWPGAWQNTLFRNEGAGLSSDLIRGAVETTIEAWGPLPEAGFLTFVNATKVRSANPGCCFLAAGWRRIGATKGGHGRDPLLAFGLG